MATWNAALEADPASSDTPSEGDDNIRETRVEIRHRIGNEHGNYVNSAMGADGSRAADWIHKRGSAVAYYQSDSPSLRPDGVTALDSVGSNDNGRLWVSNGGYRFIKAWSGGSWLYTAAGYAVSSGITASTSAINEGSAHGYTVKMAAFSTGSWNMDTDLNKRIVTSIPASCALGAIAFVRIDNSNNWRTLHSGTNNGTAIDMSNLGMNIAHLAGDDFDNSSFNSTGFNRGWVIQWFRTS